MRIMISLFIMIIPISRLKVFLYNKLLKYDIHKTCKIGLSYIGVSFLRMEQYSSIGNFNILKGKCYIEMSRNSRISKLNKINSTNMKIGHATVICNKNIFFHDVNLAADIEAIFQIGANSVITNNHYFDVCDSITIGNSCTIAGMNSEFWTHSFNLSKDRIQGEIQIGDSVYIGSSIKMSYGVRVANNTIIGMGSIITSSLLEENYVWAGNPVKKIRGIADYKKYSLIGNLPNGKNIYRKEVKS